MSKSECYVITGGPGSGKSTLISALGKDGYKCFAEAGRSVIQNQSAIGGNALPWDDPLLFAEAMLTWDIRSYEEATDRNGPIFFDRGIPDVAGYLRFIGRQVPEHVRKAIALFRYDRRVFIAPPWEDIFRQDAERKQSFEEARRTYDAMVAIYSESGYELVELPRESVEERVGFVRRNIDKGTALGLPGS